MEQYFKVTNEKENHNGFQYQDGLNVLIEKFNDDPEISCCAGGFYFTNRDDIHKFFDYGINLRIITLPKDDPDFKIVRDPDDDKWRVNKIIFGEKYSLLDHKTYELFGLDITKNDRIIDKASKFGNVDLLEWWKNSGLNIYYSSNTMDSASQHGHVHVLQWWKDSRLELKYSYFAMENASQNCHINVLDWWKNSGLELKYLTSAIDNASAHGHVDILEWWKSSGLELKYSNTAIIHAVRNDNIDVLIWWKNSGLKLSPICLETIQQKLKSTKFFKITNNDVQHEESSSTGEIYFNRVWTIFNCLTQDNVHLREVHLPVDDPDFIITAVDRDTFKANKIILGDKY